MKRAVFIPFLSVSFLLALSMESGFAQHHHTSLYNIKLKKPTNNYCSALPAIPWPIYINKAVPVDTSMKFPSPLYELRGIPRPKPQPSRKGTFTE